MTLEHQQSGKRSNSEKLPKNNKKRHDNEDGLGLNKQDALMFDDMTAGPQQ